MNATANTTHLLWVGRWVEVVQTTARIDEVDEPAWRFKSGRDAADWLRWPLAEEET